MIPPGVRIFVCPVPVDMRLGFDRLAQVARQHLAQDPVKGGAVFVFSGRSARRIKLLWWERNGLCLLYKRLHGAVFELPLGADGQVAVRIDAVALARLLGGEPRRQRGQKDSLRANFRLDNARADEHLSSA
jgi:transposase